MRLIRFIAIVVLMTATAAYGQEYENAQNEIPAGRRTFEQDNYSIRYPDDYELNSPGLMGSDFIIMPKLSSLEDIFRPNISVISQNLKGSNISLDVYAKLSEIQIELLITDASFIENERIEKDDFEFQKVIFTGKQGVFDFTWEQYWIKSICFDFDGYIRAI